jgi:hypothetical protein
MHLVGAGPPINKIIDYTGLVFMFIAHNRADALNVCSFWRRHFAKEMCGLQRFCCLRGFVMLAVNPSS